MITRAPADEAVLPARAVERGDGPFGRFVAAEGIMVHAASFGRGRPILLVHGASSDLDVFRPTVIPQLRDRYALSGYDRPGLGFTKGRPPHAHELAVQARVAADVIAGLGLTRPIILGHSYGGAVALRLALDRPDLVGGLALIAPVAYVWPGGLSWHVYWSGHRWVGPLFNRLVQPFAAGAVRDGVRGTFHPHPAPPDYAEQASVAHALRPSALGASARDLLALKQEVAAQQDRYGAIGVPVGVLAGDRDGVVSTSLHALPLAAALSNVQLTIVKGAGHVPHETSPQALVELIDWLASRSK